MKRILTLLFALLLLATVPLSLASCNKEDDAVTLYVYNWGEYISDGFDGSLDVNAAFEEWYFEQYGKRVKVNYSTFSSNEDMYAKLNSGATSYDVVFPSDYMIERMIDENMLLELDLSNIPNEKNIDYERVFKDSDGNPYYDPERRYSVPYTYGTVGLIYNTTLVDEEDISTWDLLWNEAYSGNILQFNNSRDAFATALLKLGYDLNTDDEQSWREALELLKEQKPLVQSYVMDEVFNKMKNGSAAVAPYYAGDFFSMYEDNEDLAFCYPGEGTNFFVDAMCVPKTARNPEIAEAYINFMLSEEAAVANAEYICYASPNRLVTENEDYQEAMSEMHEDAMEILYGTSDIPLSSYRNLPPEQLQMVNSLWEDLKIESAVNTVIIVLACSIVGAGVLLAVFLVVRSSRRKRIVSGLWKT